MTEQKTPISTSSLMTEKRTFPPSPEVVKRAHINAAQYQKMYERSIKDSDGFWLEQAKTLDWFKKPTVSRRYTWNTDARTIKHTWFEDGELNVAVNCLDRHLKTKVAKKVAILYPNNDYGKGLSAAIEAQLKHHGVAVASNQAYLATDKDYSALLTGIKGSDVDALAVAGTYTDGGLITKQMRGMGFTKPIVGGTGFYSPKLVEIAGPAAEEANHANA